MKRKSFIIYLLLLLSSLGISFYFSFQMSSSLSQSITPDQIAGVSLATVDARFRNPWTPELEAQFQQRAQAVIAHYANPKSYGNSYGENEKSSYPRAMFDLLAGNQKRAIAFLQAEDDQASEHAHTQGIDYYYSFTLKGQIRKYFLLGNFLDPAYKKQMYEGAKQWTAEDPLIRPHPVYGFGDGSGRDWDIKRRGKWVDSRNTDNLRAMREVAVYLMAEETGNEETRQRYQQKLQRYVSALYHIGMGEWDSESYHSHTFAAYLNLYDFAQNSEVKQLAKSALDWMSAAAAVKYYRGGWGGPVKRDYGGGNRSLGSHAARAFWLYFGDTPVSNDQAGLDTIHMITSVYRPPMAVVALAQKQFTKPVEILATKPLYENWKEGNDRYPGYWETQFFGQSYQMGSLAGTFPDGDVAPFKLMAYHPTRGVDYFLVNTGNKYVRPGKRPGDQIGQYENLLIWLQADFQQPFAFQFPNDAVVEVENNIYFFKLYDTWIALYPINLNLNLQQTLKHKKYPETTNINATAPKETYTGFALEIGDQQSHQNYANFKQKVKNSSNLDLTRLAQGIITLKGSQGKTLQLSYNQNNLLPLLQRDKTVFDWSKHFALYDSQTPNHSPIELGWKTGTLRIKAGEFTFENSVKPLL